MEFVFFFFLLCLSGFFSGTETALFSIGKVAQARLTQSENSSDQLVATLLDKPRVLLIGVLLGNELTNIALSIVAASIASNSEFLKERSMVEQAVISAAVVVPLLLILGEITPKTLASKRPEPLARFIVRPINVFLIATAPIISALRALTGVIVRFLGGASKEQDTEEDGTIDESEFRTLVDVGAQEGVVEDQERELIHKVLDFGDTLVGDVMRPWSRVFSIEERTPIDDVIKRVIGEPHSRIPVWYGDERNITGVLFAKDLLPIHWGVAPPKSVKRLRRDPLFTLARRPIAQLLEEFRARRTHMAIVVDEFGRAQGICTMEDLLEELFGPITDAHPGLDDPDDRGGDA